MTAIKLGQCMFDGRDYLWFAHNIVFLLNVFFLLRIVQWYHQLGLTDFGVMFMSYEHLHHRFTCFVFLLNFYLWLLLTLDYFRLMLAM